MNKVFYTIGIYRAYVSLLEQYNNTNDEIVTYNYQEQDIEFNRIELISHLQEELDKILSDVDMMAYINFDAWLDQEFINDEKFAVNEDNDITYDGQLVTFMNWDHPEPKFETARAKRKIKAFIKRLK